jgi:hypothetical protein
VIETDEWINMVQLNVSESCNLKCNCCFADRVDERTFVGNFAVRNDLQAIVEKRLLLFGLQLGVDVVWNENPVQLHLDRRSSTH